MKIFAPGAMRFIKTSILVFNCCSFDKLIKVVYKLTMKTLKKILVMGLIVVFGVSTLVCCCSVKSAFASTMPSCHKHTQSQKSPTSSDLPCCSKLLKSIADVEISLKNLKVELLKSNNYFASIVSSLYISSVGHNAFRLVQISPQSPQVPSFIKNCVFRL